MKQVKTPLSIYFHIPFCLQKCPYCAFYKETSHPEDLTDFYWRDLNQYSFDRNQFFVQSIYFGGGTPSLFPPVFFKNIIAQLKKNFIVSDTLEVTLEINPHTVSDSSLLSFKDAGITRPSFGVQSLFNTNLKKLGRLHSAEKALDVLAFARNHFTSYSADFIYGLPWQSLEDWEKQLTLILDLNVPHLSLYSLSLEKGTPFANRFHLDQLDQGEFYETTREVLISGGYQHYEISNFAKKESDFSQHNLAYWRGDSYLGLGPSAHGRLEISPQKWITSEGESHLNRWKKDGLNLHPISPQDRGIEMLLMALRLDAPFYENFLQKHTQQTFGDLLDSKNLRKYVEQKWLSFDKKSLHTTAHGRQFLNTLLCEILKLNI
ncbi:MAG: radical SAM family heme chaperone HemW [Alphaproteobacteria bacterium]|nr:radical SAM family heme chaperone HemW [Alphaproteobacteria bacterium]